MDARKPPAVGPLRCDVQREDSGTTGDGVQVRYCGGCNPFIDRVAVAQSVREGLNGTSPTATLYVSGCPRACASGHRLDLEEGTAVVVAGEHVDATPTAAADLAPAVISKLTSPAAPPHPDRRPDDADHNDISHTR
jgi:hypothetical protein